MVTLRPARPVVQALIVSLLLGACLVLTSWLAIS